MNVAYKRRLVRARRESAHRGGGFGRFLLISLFSLTALAFAGAAVGLGAVFVVYQSYVKDYVPIADKLRQTNIGLTEVYDRNGIPLGNLSNPDAQLVNPVPLSQISDWLVKAEVSTEDNSFYSNPGVSITGLFRGFWSNYVASDYGPGGSSITQQLVKNVYICPSVGEQPESCQGGAARTLDRKLREITYALELDKDYSKEQILQWYLNQIPYGGRYVGAQAAAQGYFREDAKDLDLAQSALLAGIPKAPTTYHPILNCIKDDKGNCVLDDQGRVTVGHEAKARQEEVLRLMVEHKIITQAQADQAKAEVLKVYQAGNVIKTSAFIDDQVEPYLVRMCEAGKLPKLPDVSDCTQSVHSAGWKVTTTLDYTKTQETEAMMRQFLAEGQAAGCNCFNASIVSIDPTTGQVMIYAPNADPSNVSDPRVAGEIDQAVEINQPGSSMKPVIYTAFFNDLNMAPMSTIWDTSPMTVDGATITDPRADGGNEGLISARAGLGGSQNVPAFRAASEVGIDNVIEMAKKTGITTLQQGFDPTFRDHKSVYYGPSIATGGANVRVIDMAYMNSVIANMGVMVGVPTLAKTMNMNDLQDTSTAQGADYDLAVQQKTAFQHGDIRLPGTRDIDPVVILKVEDDQGKVLYDHATANDLKREQVVNAGSVWLTHSIISDCESRFIIWYCGSSNTDNNLDAFMADGTKIPMGTKTGTQQGPLSSDDTLATWQNHYTRYSATAVWVGNANKELVHDGPRWGYASADATIHLSKSWLSWYLGTLQSAGVFKEPANFDSLQPKNVAFGPFKSPTTDRGHAGGCSQTVQGWYRTDVTYESQCYSVFIDSRNGQLAGPNTPARYRVAEQFVKLPELDPADAITLARRRGIPIAPTSVSQGAPSAEITNLTTGQTLTQSTDVFGSVSDPNGGGWKLEIGRGAQPAQWIQIGSGDSDRTGVLGNIDVTGAPPGTYTVRLSTDSGYSVTVSINIQPAKGQGNNDDNGGNNGNGNGNNGNGNGNGNGTGPDNSGSDVNRTPQVPH
jgi:membrane peptidoglycan carboxypeptidase